MSSPRKQLKVNGMSRSCAISPLLSFSIAAWRPERKAGADSPNHSMRRPVVNPIALLRFADKLKRNATSDLARGGARAPEEAAEFSAFLKKYIASWAGEAGLL
jgi:hypothetical protein